MGTSIEWVESISTLVARKEDTTIQLTIGQLEALVNKETVILDSPYHPKWQYLSSVKIYQ
ncbi:stalk domain-containing protein [Paenibacillus sp. GYB003]|uniref:stalk domain-containing protein n=1 Tax=Paenibacillus sp. GYB003 TaxID=2994392 RepID=UPI002F96E180